MTRPERAEATTTQACRDHREEKGSASDKKQTTADTANSEAAQTRGAASRAS